MISIIHKNVQNCKYFLEQGYRLIGDLPLVRFLHLSSLGFEFCLEHLDVMDRLDDDFQLWQFARLLELCRQHPPQVLHVRWADVGGVQVKVSNLHNHDDDVRMLGYCFLGECQVTTVGCDPAALRFILAAPVSRGHRGHRSRSGRQRVGAVKMINFWRTTDHCGHHCL